MFVKLKDANDFSKRLIRLGKSQRGFAKMIGVSGAYMCMLAKGNRNPSAEVSKKICAALGVTFDDIFFIEDDNKSYQIRPTA